MKNVKVRGLVSISGWLFVSWGGIVALKGIFDSFWGEPEANFYSVSKWEFISQKQWLNWSGFEITYGLCCIGISLLLFNYAKRLPEFVKR
jgi:hypothetical protein